MSAAHQGKLEALSWVRALREPALALRWTLADWERVVRLARRLRLLARLAESLGSAGLLAGVPAPARRHLVAEQRLSRWRTAAMQWAIERIGDSLCQAPYPRVLLKGAAYLAQDLPIAAGRLPSDLDILVPRASIDDAVALLAAAGWSEMPLDQHDKRYYRDWSHEVPPMTHPLHTLELDLHHNILPPVAHLPVDADVLLSRLSPSRLSGWMVLDPADQVLHSAAHLFFDSEFRDRLRDLVDLDGLLRHFGREASFWRRLTDRCAELRLSEPMTLALHFTTCWFGTPVPLEVVRDLAAARLGAAQRALLRPLFGEVLMPTEPDVLPGWRQGVAATVLLARYHYRRMPLKLLLPHLWHKWRLKGKSAEDAAAATPARH